MNQPSDGIARELLPHIHLVSSYRFPLLPIVHAEKAAEWLVTAPKIARDTAPFYWTYLDRPQDGTILLVWQSIGLGSDFPSDGYIWAQPELSYQIQVQNGYTIEMHHAKVGFGPGEQVATHTRKRFRLHPSQIPGAPQPDLSLWCVHYAQCDPHDRVASQAILPDMRTQSSMQTRNYLQAQGQIVQKDFMLHDRSNWPQIPFPRSQPRPAQMYSNQHQQPRIPQTMAYSVPHPASGPPPKRSRTQAPSSVAGGSGTVHELDDEEDTSRGDFFDHVTPREVSINRYTLNHEWMEEVISSPYAMHQIVPSDLGLGLRGELSSLTEGVFDAPYDPDKDVRKYPYVGRLDPGKAEEFRLKAAQHITATENEMDRMKAKHARRLAKFKKGSALLEAEKELRNAVWDPTDTGPEFWRLEGRIDPNDEDAPKLTRTPTKVDDIVARVEALLDCRAVAVQEVRRIQDGGFEEMIVPVVHATPSLTEKSAPQSHESGNATPHSGVLVNDSDDIEMANSTSGLFPSQGQSGSATPGMQPSPQAQTSLQEAANALANETGDWVVVPPGGVSPVLPPTAQQPPSNPAPTASPHPLATSTNNTPTPLYNDSPNDFNDLGDLDTAGEALAGYGDEEALDIGMDIGNSMFQDAFHREDEEEAA